LSRVPLSRGRVVEAAAAIADRDGLAVVSMRTVGRELGVEAMSLYHHVANKDALLDSLAEWVFAQLEPPPVGAPWRAALSERARSQRAVLSKHPWGLGLMESRQGAGPVLLQHHDAVLGCLFDNGFGTRLAGHAFSLLDAYVHGFVLTEVNLPFDEPGGADEIIAEMPLAAFPHLTRFAMERVAGHDYSYGEEFEVGLEMVLDAIAARLAGE
jgi:AcrR family transcriptional regulator